VLPMMVTTVMMLVLLLLLPVTIIMIGGTIRTLAWRVAPRKAWPE